jgi:carbonic anhydrase
MQKLFAALTNFDEELRPSLKTLFKDLAHGQSPEVLMFACCDSRVVPHLIASQQPGELFIARSIGNIVAPADPNGVSVGDVSEASAIEYAIEVLGIRDIAVCGHSNCEAMTAVKKGRDNYAALPNLRHWLQHGEPALERVKSLNFTSNLNDADKLSQANVLTQLDHVATYDPVRKRLRQGEVRMHGLWFDIGTAMVHLYEAEKNAFVALDETELTRLLS